MVMCDTVLDTCLSYYYKSSQELLVAQLALSDVTGHTPSHTSPSESTLRYTIRRVCSDVWLVMCM